MEDGNASDSVSHVCEQPNNAIGYIKPTAYQCDLLYVWASPDNRSCPTMHSEGTDAREVDRRESAFDPSRVFTCEHPEPQVIHPWQRGSSQRHHLYSVIVIQGIHNRRVGENIKKKLVWELEYCIPNGQCPLDGRGEAATT